ncbi:MULTISPECIES: DinB family protein [unclassified Cellulophaga]|uniref:DinB family protein n=1 Tax=unclassified Cellulophaga TaxID=2634405 RepID=UPI0026E3E2C8|nr:MULTISPECIES: DinB family protein [unclassified Cellulophaga]MDO6491082.1 DinB family protein [Cellulophaga sp. 2_MG-2023]MDO6493724.1 DinB family protein [Cellulophaga sp. 3_MG-2023]
MKASELTPLDYNPYYKSYIDLVEDTSLLTALENGRKKFKDLIAVIPDSKLNYAYASNKWTTAEAIVHIIDTERIFQYRAMRFSRLDATPLPGFEQDDYVPTSNANSRTRQSLLQEFLDVRASTISLFTHLTEKQLKFVGTASDSPMSTAAAGFVACGHQEHHSKIIFERYL